MTAELTIPPPDPENAPLKVNIYEHARGLTCTLAPLFPHLHAGAIVPTVALFWGRSAGDYGYFEHYNTVDEVVIIFGADGAAGRARTGLVRVNANTHGVGKFLPDPDDPEVFSLICITQRQAEEAIGRRKRSGSNARSCQTDIARLDFNWEPAGAKEIAKRHGATMQRWRPWSNPPRPPKRSMPATPARTCPKCGHVNPTFPLDRWGWDRYAAQTVAVNRAEAALQAIAASGPPEE